MLWLVHQSSGRARIRFSLAVDTTLVIHSGALHPGALTFGGPNLMASVGGPLIPATGSQGEMRLRWWRS